MLKEHMEAFFFERYSPSFDHLYTDDIKQTISEIKAFTEQLINLLPEKEQQLRKLDDLYSYVEGENLTITYKRGFSDGLRFAITMLPEIKMTGKLLGNEINDHYVATS